MVRLILLAGALVAFSTMVLAYSPDRRSHSTAAYPTDSHRMASRLPRRWHGHRTAGRLRPVYPEEGSPPYGYPATYASPAPGWPPYVYPRNGARDTNPISGDPSGTLGREGLGADPFHPEGPGNQVTGGTGS